MEVQGGVDNVPAYTNSIPRSSNIRYEISMLDELHQSALAETIACFKRLPEKVFKPRK